MKPLIIFGAGELAELAYFYFSTFAKRDIKAFCSDPQYICSENYMGMPLVPATEIATRFPPSDYDMFIAIGSTNVNRARREKFFEMKDTGYRLATCISPHAVVHTDHVGENCLIMDCNNIHPYTRVGNNVIFSNCNHIGHHTIIEDHCFITSNVVIGGGATIGEGSFLGINAGIRDHVRVGHNNVIGAGVMILKDTKDNEVYSIAHAKPRDVSSQDIKTL